MDQRNNKLSHPLYYLILQWFVNLKLFDTNGIWVNLGQENSFETDYLTISENFYNKSMCDVEFRISDDIRVQKRTYMKMNEVFAITGGYMQLISTIFTILTFLTKTLMHQLKLVNDIFDFYPKQNKISLKIE